MSQKEDNNDLQLKIDMRKTYLNYGYQDFKILQCDNQKIQFDYLKMYITLSTIVLSAISTSLIYFNIIKQQSPILFPKCWSEFFIILFMSSSFFSSLCLFVKGVMLLRGKNSYNFPFSNLHPVIEWMKNEDKNRTDTEKKELELCQLEFMLSILAKSLDVIAKDAGDVGKILRTLNQLLIFSILTGIFGLFTILATNN